MKVQKPKTTDRVIFIADGHSYWYGAQRLKSVGVFIKPYFPKFREGYWLTHIALKEIFGKEYKEHYSSFSKRDRMLGPPALELFPPFLARVSAKEFVDKKEEIRARWDLKRFESQFRGTKFHNEREEEVYNQGWMYNRYTNRQVALSPQNKRNKFYDNESLVMDLSKLKDGAYPELVIFDLELGICGQADMVFIETIDGVRYVDIDDHKTNEKKPPKSGTEYCLPPFDGMYACDHFKYEIQMNSYAYLLSRYGFVPRNLGYTWYKDYEVASQMGIHVENYQSVMPLLVEDFVNKAGNY